VKEFGIEIMNQPYEMVEELLEAKSYLDIIMREQKGQNG